MGTKEGRAVRKERGREGSVGLCVHAGVRGVDAWRRISSPITSAILKLAVN